MKIYKFKVYLIKTKGTLGIGLKFVHRVLLKYSETEDFNCNNIISK